MRNNDHKGNEDMDKVKPLFIRKSTKDLVDKYHAKNERKKGLPLKSVWASILLEEALKRLEEEDKEKT